MFSHYGRSSSSGCSETQVLVSSTDCLQGIHPLTRTSLRVASSSFPGVARRTVLGVGAYPSAAAHTPTTRPAAWGVSAPRRPLTIVCDSTLVRSVAKQVPTNQ